MKPQDIEHIPIEDALPLIRFRSGARARATRLLATVGRVVALDVTREFLLRRAGTLEARPSGKVLGEWHLGWTDSQGQVAIETISGTVADAVRRIREARESQARQEARQREQEANADVGTNCIRRRDRRVRSNP